MLPTDSAVVAQRLAAESIEYLGRFAPPAPEGDGPTATWSWGTRGLTLIPDCLGRTDPSPDDGYPGCLGAFGHAHASRFGVFDIVPPGSRARQVVPFYDLGAGLPRQILGEVGSEQYWDVLYDAGPEHCRLWWTYGTFYVRIAEDPPFLGVSTCDPEDPRPRGMWDFGREGVRDIQRDPFATAKMYQALSLIPAELAGRLFDGKRMALGISRKSGTRGGSQGPSLYVRSLEPPAVDPPGPALDATPLVWYRLTNYVKWWDEPQMRGGASRHWTESHASGAEFLTGPAGSAVVLPWEEPTVERDRYPCADPTAYRDGRASTPDPCEVPVCWYGLARCEPGKPAHLQPSFWEDRTDGRPMPPDCRLEDPCRDHTGPHCLGMKPFLLFYDVAELAAVYAGERRHHEPQPYAKLPLEKHFMHGARCGSGTAGSTYDPVRQLLFVGRGGERPSVHVFAVAGG